MSTVQVVRADVQDAAAKVQAAAAGVGSVSPGSDLSGVGEALPGSDSAGAASALVSEWDQQFSSWKTDAEDQHDRLVSAVNHIEQTDVAVATGFGRPAGAMPW